MRIAFVEHRLNLKSGGGSNITLGHMASCLARLGHEVRVITVAPSLNRFEPGLPFEVIEEPIGTGFLNLKQKLSLVQALKKWESRLDVIQVEAPSLILAGAIYRKTGGLRPVVARLHNYSLFCSNLDRMDASCFRHCSLGDRIRHREESRWRKTLRAPIRVAEQLANRVLVNGVDRFIALTPAVADIYARQGVARDRMAVMPPMIDLAALTPRGRSLARAIPATPEPFRIMYAGRLTRGKGVDVLLRAVSGLPFRYSLEIVGEGTARSEFERLAGALGLGASARFTGWMSQASIVERYASADLFVHPGRWPEPAGRTVLESMALGIPLIVSDIGGPPWLARDAALTFPPEDHEALRRAIIRLHDDPRLGRRLASTGQRRVQEFAIAPSAARLLALYAELCPADSAIQNSAGASVLATSLE
jgi:glycosyltransferase involved in cell wall biosynthesis